MGPESGGCIYAQLEFYCSFSAFLKVLELLEYNGNKSLLDDIFSIYDVKLRFFIPLQLSQVIENDSNFACCSRLEA